MSSDSKCHLLLSAMTTLFSRPQAEPAEPVYDRHEDLVHNATYPTAHWMTGDVPGTRRQERY